MRIVEDVHRRDARSGVGGFGPGAAGQAGRASTQDLPWDSPLPCGTEAARRRHLAHGEELCPACHSLDDPHVWVSPARKFGRPCVASTRLPTETVAEWMWNADSDGGAAALFEAYPYLTRSRMLVACWYQATHGSPRWRRRWKAWADGAGQAMWHAGAVDYDLIPDPPSKEEVARDG